MLSWGAGLYTRQENEIMLETGGLERECSQTEQVLAAPVHDLDELAIQRVFTQIGYQQRDALSAKQKGQYGLCSRCMGQIEPGCIDAVPYATLCATCACAAKRAKRRGR